MSNQAKPQTGNCSACGAKIVWLKTEKNLKWQPFDAKPERRAIMVQKKVLDPHDKEIEITVARSVAAYMAHHATCPDSEKFRKGK